MSDRDTDTQQLYTGGTDPEFKTQNALTIGKLAFYDTHDKYKVKTQIPDLLIMFISIWTLICKMSVISKKNWKS